MTERSGGRTNLTDETSGASESMEMLLSFHSDETPVALDAPRG